MIWGLIAVLWLFAPTLAVAAVVALLTFGLRAAGRSYNRRHQPPAWTDADFIWAEQEGITVPEGSE
jgi:uncharacterized membrane protein YbhN (UPF0104 family)